MRTAFFAAVFRAAFFAGAFPAAVFFAAVFFAAVFFVVFVFFAAAVRAPAFFAGADLRLPPFAGALVRLLVDTCFFAALRPAVPLVGRAAPDADFPVARPPVVFPPAVVLRAVALPDAERFATPFFAAVFFAAVFFAAVFFAAVFFAAFFGAVFRALLRPPDFLPAARPVPVRGALRVDPAVLREPPFPGFFFALLVLRPFFVAMLTSVGSGAPIGNRLASARGAWFCRSIDCADPTSLSV